MKYNIDLEKKSRLYWWDFQKRRNEKKITGFYFWTKFITKNLKFPYELF